MNEPSASQPQDWTAARVGTGTPAGYVGNSCVIRDVGRGVDRLILLAVGPHTVDDATTLIAGPLAERLRLALPSVASVPRLRALLLERAAVKRRQTEAAAALVQVAQERDQVVEDALPGMAGQLAALDARAREATAAQAAAETEAKALEPIYEKALAKAKYELELAAREQFGQVVADLRTLQHDLLNRVVARGKDELQRVAGIDNILKDATNVGQASLAARKVFDELLAEFSPAEI